MLHFTYDTPDTRVVAGGGPRRSRLRIRRNSLGANHGGISTKICGHQPRCATPRIRTRSPTAQDHSSGAFRIAWGIAKRTCHMGCPDSSSVLRRVRHISSISSGDRFVTRGTLAASTNVPTTHHAAIDHAAPHAAIDQDKATQRRLVMPRRPIMHSRRYGSGNEMRCTTKVRVTSGAGRLWHAPLVPTDA
ncbi:hypothetical protein LMG7141_03930 [Ralstonia condita]|uniref:Uncharacterized protein n=1 Tax=Ralstonia condita TaxID=3058600 RepID=A0ABM9JRT7_9RALS|nr:hypothetical protein LMG7141_03930 [Ralstonia sp. LMG 7141]